MHGSGVSFGPIELAAVQRCPCRSLLRRHKVRSVVDLSEQRLALLVQGDPSLIVQVVVEGANTHGQMGQGRSQKSTGPEGRVGHRENSRCIDSVVSLPSRRVTAMDQTPKSSSPSGLHAIAFRFDTSDVLAEGRLDPASPRIARSHLSGMESALRMYARNVYRSLGFAAFFLLAACSTTSPSPELSTHATLVPFEASVSATVDLTGAGTFELSGAGSRSIASHLGRVGFGADGTLLDPTTAVLIETFTAANGDTLTIRCDQILDEIAPDVYRGTDRWTVIGGTGRFADATGEGTGETHIDLDTNTFTQEFDGAIGC